MLLFALLVLVAGAVSADEPLRIMPLGDSITAGYLNPSNATTWGAQPFEFGYRSRLHTLLTDAGVRFRFVGGSQEPWNNAYGDPTLSGAYTPPLDLRVLGQDGHRGYGGADANELRPNVASWIATDDPDIILLMAGTNGYNRPQNTIWLNELVNAIVTTKPNTHLVVAEIMPRYTYFQEVVDYNAYIRNTLVPLYQGLGYNVSSVDQYANFLTDPSDLMSIDQSLFSNGINHPSTAGYAKMADTWFDAIQGLPPLPPDPIDPGESPNPPSLRVTTALHGPFIPSTITDEVYFAGDVSDSDLLHGLVGTHVGWRNRNGALDASLNDGHAGGDYDSQGLAALSGAAWASDGDHVSASEFVLGLGSEGLGYDITEIRSFAAWQGAGFANQKYEVSVRYAGDDAFTVLAIVDYQPFDSLPLNNGGSTKVTLTDDTAVLARGVEAIRFSVLDVNSPDTAGSVYREIDVFGVATRPALPGDFNGDGVIDAADYTVWRDNLSAANLEPYELADGNGDGVVNLDDYAVWKSQFGGLASAALGTETPAVPEPSSEALGVMSAAVAIAMLAIRPRALR